MMKMVSEKIAHKSLTRIDSALKEMNMGQSVDILIAALCERLATMADHEKDPKAVMLFAEAVGNDIFEQTGAYLLGKSNGESDDQIKRRIFAAKCEVWGMAPFGPVKA